MLIDCYLLLVMCLGLRYFMEDKETESAIVKELREEITKKNEQAADTLNKSKELQKMLTQKETELATLKTEYALLQSSLNKIKTKANISIQKVQACIKIEGNVWVLFQDIDNKPVTFNRKLRVGWR